MINCYYLGEFGFFNFSILGNLYNILLEKKYKFLISTYEDYYIILKKLYPDNFYPNNFIKDHDDLNRQKHKAKKQLDGVDLSCFLLKNKTKKYNKQYNKISEKYKDLYGLTNLKKPIISNNINNIKITKPIISLCCRNRKLEEARNLSKSEWDYVIKIIKLKFKNSMIVFHGLPEETYAFEIENSYVCKNIEESIFILNNSLLLISSMSGFSQFASNCKCNILQIGTNKCWIDYNPFNKINRLLDRNEIDKLNIELNEYRKKYY